MRRTPQPLRHGRPPSSSAITPATLGAPAMLGARDPAAPAILAARAPSIRPRGRESGRSRRRRARRGEVHSEQCQRIVPHHRQNKVRSAPASVRAFRVHRVRPFRRREQQWRLHRTLIHTADSDRLSPQASTDAPLPGCRSSWRPGALARTVPARPTPLWRSDHRAGVALAAVGLSVWALARRKHSARHPLMVATTTLLSIDQAARALAYRRMWCWANTGGGAQATYATSGNARVCGPWV